MKIEDDNNKAEGFMYPDNRTDGENKFYVGYDNLLKEVNNLK
ncbi:MAG TPA: hypothetical protein VLA74_14200 [Nitrososphaeraceae archaeon]|nr:hypothetical protein [Nitrososphaeraceae archaeon]